MNTIKVFGHKAPDTDTVCSAIVWSWFLNNHRNTSAMPYMLGAPNTEAAFVLDYWKTEAPQILDSVSPEDVVAIVDTNNADELFENINDCDIVSIIDHHKLVGGLKTSTPREVVIQPYASTMTVMYNIMNIEPQDFPKEIAGMMLSGILSDTLAFRSPTTTADDQLLGEKLAETLGVDIEAYSSEMFTAKSDISHFSDVELLRLDSKIYDLKGSQTRVAVLETTDPHMVLERKDSIIEAMSTVAQEDNVERVLLFVIDILNQEATVLVPDDATKQILEVGFETSIGADAHVLPGVVSRKKQIVPALS